MSLHGYWLAVLVNVYIFWKTWYNYHTIYEFCLSVSLPAQTQKSTEECSKYRNRWTDEHQTQNFTQINGQIWKQGRAVTLYPVECLNVFNIFLSSAASGVVCVVQLVLLPWVVESPSFLLFVKNKEDSALKGDAICQHQVSSELKKKWFQFQTLYIVSKANNIKCKICFSSIFFLLKKHLTRRL